MLYLETSALAKLYLLEAGSAEVARTIERSQPWLYTSRVTYPEVLSLLGRCVRERRISRVDYCRQKEVFLRNWTSLHVIELTASCLAPAERIIEQYALRGFDAVHLCCALTLGTPEFACFDARLRRAAKAEGLSLTPHFDSGAE